MKMHQTILSVNQNTSTNRVKSIFKFFLPWVLQFLLKKPTIGEIKEYLIVTLTVSFFDTLPDFFFSRRDLQKLWFVPLKGLIFRFLIEYNAFGKLLIILRTCLWFTDAFRKFDPGQSQQKPRITGKIFLWFALKIFKHCLGQFFLISQLYLLSYQSIWV